MYKVVGVRFKKAGKIYYFDPGDLDIKKDQFVIVETSRGIEYGKVVTSIKEVGEEDVVLPLKKVIRVATAEDKLQVDKNKAAAEEAYDICLEKIAEHGLEMKLVDVEYTFDRNKVIFYFTADGRVDFRELVKDLAAIFRTRIELRQIGVRDEAKMLGGIGPCGRILCCSSFLGDFEPVSIKMAKEQNLSLNPAKISGLCGRLMCCLKYENDQYESAIKELPDIGEEAFTPLGAGRVVGLNILEKLIQVELKETERVVEFALDELIDHQSQQKALPSQAEGAPS
ncbi:cell fate regulator YaaT (PSP1 superfamily) [Caldalkalibacillus uzonensis]|uniref:Cell fate regulator YaaT (PSP1 superfamily) n=1 Tax=Caldalkalibacillus uzonensis TaxID=353224 RepID=A0ABU0CXJ9_9BACI|nr:stage 0 sporulation family protein [Caldalkalibacillus uzonensis]MDQ0340620.1 cell fate regulator YaaT (PSP1 superfamily) [Caldalkalibacillus uzonensis]